MTIQLQLYGHGYCHLCDEMRTALQPLRAKWGFEVDFIDIEGDHELEQEFGEKVPVLARDRREICRYRLDQEALVVCLRDR